MKVCHYVHYILKSTLGCFIHKIYRNQCARRVGLTKMENLRDSIYGEKKKYVFCRRVQFKMLSGLLSGDVKVRSLEFSVDV